MIAAAPTLLRVLGAGYSAHGSTLLRLVALSIVPTAVVVLYETFVWYEAQLWLFAAVEAARTALLLVTSCVLLNRMRIEAAGIGLLVANATVATLVAPAAVRRWRALLQDLVS